MLSAPSRGYTWRAISGASAPPISMLPLARLIPFLSNIRMFFHSLLLLSRTSSAVFTCFEKKYPRLAEAYGPSLPVKTYGSSSVVSGWSALPSSWGFGFTFGVLGLPSSLHNCSDQATCSARVAYTRKRQITKPSN